MALSDFFDVSLSVKPLPFAFRSVFDFGSNTHFSLLDGRRACSWRG